MDTIPLPIAPARLSHAIKKFCKVKNMYLASYNANVSWNEGGVLSLVIGISKGYLGAGRFNHCTCGLGE